MSEASHIHESQGRSPCLPLVIALGAGIAFDHAWSLPRVGLFAAAGVSLFSLVLCRDFQRPARVAVLLILFATIGALSHRTSWSDRSERSVTRLLAGSQDEESRLVRLVGTVASHPVVERRRDAGRKAAWPVEDRSRMTVNCEALIDSVGATLPITGQIQLTVSGHIVDVSVGDQIQVVGWMKRPGRARNPGGFDAERFLRLKRIDAVMHVDHPNAVRHIEVSGLHLSRVLGRFRDRISYQFAEHLSDENLAVGKAMLLGDRTAIPVETRDAYAASGAMHILAISGLHVGILAALLLTIFRVLGVSMTLSAIIVIGVVWLYAALTSFGPPVVRASLFVTIWSFATVQMKRTSLLNVVAATALLLLMWNPMWLFDVGARLSFLAVLGMSWSLRVFQPLQRGLSQIAETIWMGSLLHSIASVQLLGFGIWVFTAPMIAAEFQIVSPVGFLLNVVLLPLTTVVMWAGYLFFAACGAVPQVAELLALFFGAGLSLVNWLVLVAASWKLGHFSTPYLPTWWLCGLYLLLLTSLVSQRLPRVRVASILAAWCIAGLAFGSVTDSAIAGELRMVVLDVGHGGAVLIEAPNGQSLLFDCGSMEDDRRAAEAVWNELRARGRSSLDAIIISHADLDHCNNAPAVLRGGPVGAVLVARSFLDFEQPVVVETCETARSENVPIRLIAAGDALKLDAEVSIEVLHPPDRPPGDDDNANSIVLRIEAAGRTLLLTGDVEGFGQEELMANHPSSSCDVVLAPHHGGLKANTARFAVWADADAVLVSCGQRVNAAALEATYPNAQLHFTSRTGALLARIARTGELIIEPAVPARNARAGVAQAD